MILKNAYQVAEWRLCVGCGACSYICPEQNVKLINIINHGIRPTYDPAKCRNCGDCIKVCPGYEIILSSPEKDLHYIKELKKGWGTILEVWEGYAKDPDIRFHGSSGGLASALALYCLEKEGMYGVLHTVSNEKNPLFNRTVLSRRRTDILSGAGSRYSPASPCSELKQIDSAPGSCVFIGKPCDIAGLRKAASMRKALDKKIGAVIGIFCAGTPSTQGTIELLGKLNVNPNEISLLRYRGNGWPGLFSVQGKNNTGRTMTLTYKEAWGFIQAYRPYRCYLCPDSTSEMADISCGDPWYRETKDGEPGYSLVLVRTQRGRQLLRGAIDNGYVAMERVEPKTLCLSQREVSIKRGAVWGRLLTMRVGGIPTPNIIGYSLLGNWFDIPIMEKVRSIFGTMKRIIKRRYYKKQPISI